MERYDGPKRGDKTVGGHGYLKTHDYGAECFNFSNVAGKVYGYRPGGRGPDISRLGARNRDDSISDVTVVWIARHPSFKKSVIIGWYKNAIVYRKSQPRRDTRLINGEAVEYSVEANYRTARLLDIPARRFLIPTEKDGSGALGQSPIWYGRDDAFRQRVHDYIKRVEKGVDDSRRRGGRSGGGRPRQPDVEKRLIVEQRAVAHATQYFSSVDGGGHNIVPVEREAKGWDLEAKRSDEQLYIEVKGCSGNDVVAELTPNELLKMRDPSIRNQYVIYIATGCYGKDASEDVTPLAHIFRYRRRSGNGIWESDDGRVLNVREVTAARISADSPR
jgi:hypothetical protein